jgi:hypothetical protein
VHILIDFRTVVIVFLFGGPDSGQQLGLELGPYSTENPVHCQALVRQKTTDLLDRVDL